MFTSVFEGRGMRSFLNLWNYPAGRPLVSDDITEFHAARLILLLAFSGIKGHIVGLTKLAKLDFFVRYPNYFEIASDILGQTTVSSMKSIESRMIRYRYGPWDKRYYDILSYLKSKGLVTVTKDQKGTFRFELTDIGNEVAKEMANNSEFSILIEQMKKVKKVLGSKSGSALKNLIYEIFDIEVAQKPLDEVI